MKFFKKSYKNKQLIINILGAKFSFPHLSASAQLLRDTAKKSTDIKLVVGAAGTAYEGWISTNIDDLNLCKKKDWKMLFRKNSINRILAEHVWEHLTFEEGRSAIANALPYLRVGGRIRLAVPDGFHPDKDYIDMVKPGGNGVGSEDHKLLFNYQLIQKLCESLPCQIKFLEYFDEHGIFNRQNWSPEDGMILRSAEYDRRNKDGQLHYTSLIADIIKI